MITIRELTKRYDQQPVIEQLSLDIEEGTITALMSPSGAGKTTLLRLLARLESPGRGIIQGQGTVSMLFQEDRLFPWMTAQQNIAVVSDQETANEIIAQMHLHEFASKYPGELSGGMQRRIAIARTFAFPADTILLDEPFKGLDEKMMLALYDTVLTLCADKTMIMTTHDVHEAATLASRVICFSKTSMQIYKDILMDTSMQMRDEIKLKQYMELIRE